MNLPNMIYTSRAQQSIKSEKPPSADSPISNDLSFQPFDTNNVLSDEPNNHSTTTVRFISTMEASLREAFRMTKYSSEYANKYDEDFILTFIQ